MRGSSATAEAKKESTGTFESLPHKEPQAHGSGRLSKTRALLHLSLALQLLPKIASSFVAAAGKGTLSALNHRDSQQKSRVNSLNQLRAIFTMAINPCHKSNRNFSGGAI